MSFDTVKLGDCIQAHGPTVRIVITDVKGSAPREAGTSMLVWNTGQSGTIGGGMLEHTATTRARDMLKNAPTSCARTELLGPAMGQCCGGSVSLVFERFDAAPKGGVYIRPIGTTNTDIPAILQRRITAAQGNATTLAPLLVSGWLAEFPVQSPTPIWIYGAGHVGAALATMLAPLPQYTVTLIDTDIAHFPIPLLQNITPLVAGNLAALVPHAPPNTHHYIMTKSHAADLQICNALLHHAFDYAGLIGSKTKWARFKNRLRQLGHTDADINSITCPIGEPNLGRHPQAIAVGILHAVLQGNTDATKSTQTWTTQKGHRT